MFLRIEDGQATVEAAFMIPVLFVVLLLLLQPGIILYDRVVMSHAAAEGCRLLATSNASFGTDDAQCAELIRRRLGAIPQQDIFHVHEGGCSYQVDVSGGGESSLASVSIENKVRLLPLFDSAAALAGLAEDGCIVVKVECQIETQPDWVSSSASGIDPDAWVHSRD